MNSLWGIKEMNFSAKINKNTKRRRRRKNKPHPKNS